MASFAETSQVFHAVIRNRALRRVLVSFFFFNAAEWATWVAMLVYAFDRGGATAAGLVAIIQLIPATIVAPLGSIMGDRMPRDRALGSGYLAQSIAMGGTSLALMVGAPVGVIYALAAASASAVTLTRPVHNAILPELAETPEELTASNSASGTLEGLSVFAGPLAAGILMSESGTGAVFAVFALTQALAGILTIHLPRHRIPEEDEPKAALMADAVEGLRALRREPGAALLSGMVGAQQVVWGMLDVLAVVLALEVFGLGAAGPGVVTSAAGIGGLIGAAATVVLVGRRRLAPAVVVGIAITGIPLALVGAAPGVVLALLLLVVSGGGQAFFTVASRTLLQRTVDDEVLARVFGLQEAMMMAGLAIGAALAPILVAAFGGRGAFVVAGAVLPLVGLATWGRLRKLDARAKVPGAEMALLRSIGLFQPLEQPVIERLSWNLEPAEAGAGSVVIHEGERGDRFYILVEGRAHVSVGGQPVAELGPGSYFGEIALLRNVPRTATVTAIDDLRLLTLEREEFLAAVTGSRPSTEAADREVDRRLQEHPRDTR